MNALIRSAVFLLIFLPSLAMGANQMAIAEGPTVYKPQKERVILKTFHADVIHTYEVLLYWTTKVEQRNAFFKIEKSRNLIDFELVGKIPSKGNGTNQKYQILDSGLETGTYYYRLSHQDREGKKHMLIYMSVHVKGNNPSVVISELPMDQIEKHSVENELVEAGLSYLLPGIK